MLIAKRLFLNVYSLEPVLVVQLGIGFFLQPDLRVHAAEVHRAPHFVGVELVRAPILIAVSYTRVINTGEEGVTGLETKFAVEDVAVGVAHQVEPVVADVHIS